MDLEIRKTLEDICIFIGISVDWKNNATLQTYLERLIEKARNK